MQNLPTIHTYLAKLKHTHASLRATEHSYRSALQELLQQVKSGPRIRALNEPKQLQCGAPDFVLLQHDVPLGYVETKDIGKNLDDASYAEQLNRYTESLDNLIFTDYLEFRLFRDRKQVECVCLGKLSNGKIKSLPQNFHAFAQLLDSFINYHGQRSITTATELAKHMANKARLLRENIIAVLAYDKTAANQTNKLQEQHNAFKQYLIRDLSEVEFADVYAQTIAYGMFAARLNDPSSETFSRQHAAKLIPHTNPFLRKFFQHIAGEYAELQLDDRIAWIVDDLATLFRATAIDELMQEYGKATQQNDPFLHFYETFLTHYNAKQRKEKGAFYTPQPVVDFIVRAVDEILKKEFQLTEGLADTDKINITTKDGEREVHRVQILDPAAGTGTFLAAIIQHIYQTNFINQKGIWESYVNENLIPRLNGFEVMMTPYAVAHTKLALALKESGCALHKRLQVFLTNSLDQPQTKEWKSIFADWLAEESNQANRIKRDTPMMVVIGNPPYAIGSSNKGDWIQKLIGDYKKDLNERKLNLDDDYIKFIRYGEYMVQETGEGVLAYISNNSFLDGVTHRQMRKHLMETFDVIYILDLHGNARKKETAPDGSKDQNVFNIMQGVSINLFVKTGNKVDGELAKLFHYDLYGMREAKYEFLNQHNFDQIQYKAIAPVQPYYFFVPKDFSRQKEYENGFKVTELISVNVAGVDTNRDAITVHFTSQSLKNTINDFIQLTKAEIAEKYQTKDARDWKINRAIEDVKNNIDRNNVWQEIAYRPFDIRKTFYSGKQNGFVCNGRYKIMRHMLQNNIGLIVNRGTQKDNIVSVFISNKITDAHIIDNKASVLPLYLYPDKKQQSIDNKTIREPNLKKEIVQNIASRIGLRYVPEGLDSRLTDHEHGDTFTPLDVLDYIYAVLHAPAYREKYGEFLKIDFPRVPYPTTKKQFRSLAQLGGELRKLHLLQNISAQQFNTRYEQSGDHLVEYVQFALTDPAQQIGKVQINARQCFAEVPQLAWEFSVGGYRPAQKWLKDRKGRKLGSEDIKHYQKIIFALTETSQRMQEIDQVWGLENSR